MNALFVFFLCSISSIIAMDDPLKDHWLEIKKEENSEPIYFVRDRLTHIDQQIDKPVFTDTLKKDKQLRSSFLKKDKLPLTLQELDNQIIITKDNIETLKGYNTLRKNRLKDFEETGHKSIRLEAMVERRVRHFQL